MKSILDKAMEISKEFDKNIVVIVVRDAKTGKVDLYPFGKSQVEMMIGMAAGDQAKRIIETTKVN